MHDVFSAGVRIKTWGVTGAFWGGIWGMLLAPAVFVLPGLGLIGMAGPFVSMLVVHGSAEDQAKAREALADAKTAVAALNHWATAASMWANRQNALQ